VRRRHDDITLSRRGPVYTGNRILVVTEGSRTEPLYFEALKARLRIHTLQVEVVHPDATDPARIVDSAIARLKDSRKAARRGGPPAFDEAWVVFDHESFQSERRMTIPQAVDAGRREGIRFSLSNPCFEFWFLLHFRQTTRPYGTCEELLRDVKKHLPDYAKGKSPFDALRDKLTNALANAEHCRRHHRETRGDGNPSTDVDLLVLAINDAASPANRMSPGSCQYTEPMVEP
jgi:hypothetical protein